MRRRGIFALCLLALTLIGCKSMMKALTAVPEKPDRRTEFQQAIERMDTKQIARLIKKSTPEEKRYGLFLAIKYAEINLFRLEVTPKEVVRLFLEGGVDVNSVNFGKTPLIEACWLSNLGRRYDVKYDIAELLLEKGADVNVVAGDGESALLYAINNGRDDMVRLLIRHGADVNVQYDGRTLLYIAQVSKKNTEIADMLREAGAKPAKTEELAIQKAVEAIKQAEKQKEEIEKLKKELEQGSNNFYSEVIYKKGTPIKTGEQFIVKKDRIKVLDRTTSQAGYTYLVTYYTEAYERAIDYANSFSGGGKRYCFLIQLKRQMALHQNLSLLSKEQYITSVNDLILTCIGKSQYQQNYQDVECYVFTLDAEL